MLQARSLSTDPAMWPTPVKRAIALSLAAAIGALAIYVSFDDPQSAPEMPPVQSEPPRMYRHADFGAESASADARSIADWIADSGDNQGLPFAIVDKVDARVFVFEPAARLIGASPALLGLARGDESVPGIGEKSLAQITPGERTTPAGRFVAEPGVNLKGERIVWVDYDAGLSMHAVRSHVSSERRLQRLASATPSDNRISYGCINVPRDFFRSVVAPAFEHTRGIVYVLPETQPARVVFGAYEVPESAPDAVALTRGGK